MVMVFVARDCCLSSIMIMTTMINQPARRTCSLKVTTVGGNRVGRREGK